MTNRVRVALGSSGWAPRLLLVVTMMGVAGARAAAQQVGTVTGRVSAAASGRPLESAQVYLVGTPIGSLTTPDGRFLLLNVPAGAHQLRVELIGMETQTVAVTVTPGGTVTADVALQQVALGLDEIVVTGTAGGARQRQVGNSINVINRASAVDLPTSMETMLQAQAPGMTVMQNSGQIGGGAQIRLRGAVSATMSNQPLIYIDGVRVSSDPYPQ